MSFKQQSVSPASSEDKQPEWTGYGKGIKGLRLSPMVSRNRILSPSKLNGLGRRLQLQWEPAVRFYLPWPMGANYRCDFFQAGEMAVVKSSNWSCKGLETSNPQTLCIIIRTMDFGISANPFIQSIPGVQGACMEVKRHSSLFSALFWFQGLNLGYLTCEASIFSCWAFSLTQCFFYSGL